MEKFNAEAGKSSELEKLELKYPELASTLETLNDPAVTNEGFFEAVDAFNNENMKKKEGMYQSISMDGEHGHITVKYYENGSASISANWEK